MDYRQLLEPKKLLAKEKSKRPTPNYGPQQSRKAATMSHEQSPSATTKMDPKALLDPRSAAKETTRTPLAGNSDALGMGSLVERLHGATPREAPPPKKRRIIDSIDSDEPQKSTTSFSMSAGTGIIGGYMKGERQKAAFHSGPSTEPIDLTNDDDDDLMFMGSKMGNDASKIDKGPNSTREVCLGRVVAKALVFRIPVVPRYTAEKEGSQIWPQLRVHYKRSADMKNLRIDLFSQARKQDSTDDKVKGIAFGNLEAKIGAVLCPLLINEAATGLRLKFYLEAFTRNPGEFPGHRISRNLNVGIMIYARRDKADMIGRILSQGSYFLSKPQNVELGTEIYNPHVPQSFGTIGAGLRRPQGSQQVYTVNRSQEEITKETMSMFDSLSKANDELPEMEADSSLISTPLMSHQKQALHFLTEHERVIPSTPEGATHFSLWRPRVTRKGDRVWYHLITDQEVSEPPQALGGILADVMGLGKTLSMLALVAETRAAAEQFGEQDSPLEMERVVRNAKATLIVCPKSVLSNWIDQIGSHTHRNKFKVYSYHGSQRTQDLDELAEYDIVLAPYQTAAAEYGSNQKRTALASINWFRIVLDEAHQIRNPSTGVSKACCALSAQRRWALTGTPVQNRLDDLGALMKYIRIKPFDTANGWAQHMTAKFKIGDENALSHLRVLVDSITLRRMKDTVGLPDRLQVKHRLNFSEDERLIYSQFAKQANVKWEQLKGANGKLRGRSYAHMLKSITRLRQVCAHSQEMLGEDDMKELEGLTAGTAIDLGDEPDDEPDETFITERSAYDFLIMASDSLINSCISCSTLIAEKKNSPKESENSDSDTDSDSDSDSDSDDEHAQSSDYDAVDDIMGYLTPCFHLICPDCREKFVETATPRLTADHYFNCTYCDLYVRFGLFTLRRSGLRNLVEMRANANRKAGKARWDETTYSGPHTKVRELIKELKASEAETEMLPLGEPPIRSVVFSGWTTYLDLIEYALEQHNIGFLRLDGKMSVKARSAVLRQFAADPVITVLLVSIKAGGQGLNFTAANKVYMMEPQFNPGVEEQAIDRVHRLGQKRNVKITHYLMADSIEEKIVLLQEKKQKLAALSMERKLMGKGESAQTMQDLLSLVGNGPKDNRLTS